MGIPLPPLPPLPPPPPPPPPPAPPAPLRWPLPSPRRLPPLPMPPPPPMPSTLPTPLPPPPAPVPTIPNPESGAEPTGAGIAPSPSACAATGAGLGAASRLLFAACFCPSSVDSQPASANIQTSAAMDNHHAAWPFALRLRFDLFACMGLKTASEPKATPLAMGSENSKKNEQLPGGRTSFFMDFSPVFRQDGRFDDEPVALFSCVWTRLPTWGMRGAHRDEHGIPHGVRPRLGAAGG